MGYDAVVFDNDGVLTELTAVSVLRAASRETLEAHGVTDPTDEDVETITLSAKSAALDRLGAKYDLDVDALWATRDGTAAAHQIAEIRAGRKALYDDFDAVRALDQPLGIVSSNQHETIEAILAEFDLHDLFETYYGREPTTESIRLKKPNPHYIDRALSDLGTRDALYVGDSESDVVAAQNAGIDSAYVARPHRPADYLDVEPTHLLDGLDDLHDIV
ncbi:HAD family hydrolase [Haloarchaeobius sp. DFWS5]|uniref:HAD family hydrolase n=1 Tax=Haloarchaeobius sp. DFWS5 TaxID=3446114 RepID=UPI003EBE0655